MWKLKINTPNDEVYSTIITNTTAIDFDTTSITKTVYGTAETTHDTNKKKIKKKSTTKQQTQFENCVRVRLLLLF